MADITTVNNITESGLGNLTFSTATESGDKFENNGKYMVVVKNAGEESVTVTFTAQTTTFVSPTYGTASISNKTLVIAGGRTGYICSLPVNAFNNSDGDVVMTYSQVTNVSVAICSVSN
mgnify:CR=1 FL=1|tara:strand:- start:1750 stop:2106 length:357 start_codon:yes stop_codon:yes gene_type:complete